MIRNAIAGVMTFVAVVAADAAESVSVTVPGDSGVVTNCYNLSNAESARAYVDAYADNIQYDAAFRVNEAAALATIRKTNRFFGSWIAILPAVLAILLALITKEVYSSLFFGIVAGGLLYSGGSFEGTMTHVMSNGFIKSVADPYNVGILFFLVFLGALVAMMNKTGASAAFGKWAESRIKSRVGVQLATALLGVLIFIDDYFNCLTVGSVMRPVADAKRVSRAKLAYLIDSTAAPICIIAPISSWAAAVAGFAKGVGVESGFALFVSAIPYNFYAILTIVMMAYVSLTKFDFGAMKRIENDTLDGNDRSAANSAAATVKANPNGKVCDLIVPAIVLVAACVVGMVYSGGYFNGGVSFAKAISDSDASVGLVDGSIVAIVFAVGFYLCRRVVTFGDCMASFPEGFREMVPAIMILCCAWTLKAMTDSLGAKVFVSDLINGPAASLHIFLPAIIFCIAAALAFSTGTSWSTFGILIPIVISAMPAGELAIIAVSSCMAGAVCGNHCSPISDTTIMASAGAQCDHVTHVNTQLPYVLTVVAVSCVSYLIAAVTKSAWISLPISIALLIGTMTLLRAILRKSCPTA